MSLGERSRRVPPSPLPFPREVGNDWNVTLTLANSSAAYHAVVIGAMHLNEKTELPATVREAAILRIGAVLGSGYEWGRHVPRARAAGLSDAAIRELRTGRYDALGADEIAAAEHAEAVDARAVTPEAWERICARFSLSQVVELTTLSAFYGQMCRILLALDVGLDDDIDGLDVP